MFTSKYSYEEVMQLTYGGQMEFTSRPIAPMAGHTIPTVIEDTGRMVRTYDLYSRLLKDFIVFLPALDGDFRSDTIMGQLLYLNSENPTRDIFLYINSPGGVITSGLSIYDTMDLIDNDIVTVVNGQAASMGAVLAAAGTKGKRIALPSSRIMIHQPLGGAQGQESDIERQYKEMKRLRKKLEGMLADFTGQSVEKIHEDCERDYWMDAREARDYGIVDHVLSKGKTLQDLMKEIDVES